MGARWYPTTIFPMGTEMNYEIDTMLPIYLGAEFLPLEWVVKLMQCCHVLRRQLPKIVEKVEARDVHHNSNVSIVVETFG